MSTQGETVIQEEPRKRDMNRSNNQVIGDTNTMDNGFSWFCCWVDNNKEINKDANDVHYVDPTTPFCGCEGGDGGDWGGYDGGGHGGYDGGDYGGYSGGDCGGGGDGGGCGGD